MAPNPDGSYTKDEMRDIVNAHVLTLRLEAIERRHEEGWRSFAEHITSEGDDIKAIRDDIAEIKERQAGAAVVVSQCKAEIEERIRSQYVTKEQLDLSLARMGEALSHSIGDRLDKFGGRMDAKLERAESEIRQNSEQMKRFIAIGTGVLLTIMAVAWIAEMVDNGASAINGVQQLGK